MGLMLLDIKKSLGNLAFHDVWQASKIFQLLYNRNKLSDETHLFGCRKEFLWQKSALPSNTGNTGIYCSLQDRLVPQLLLPVLLLIRHDLVSYLNKMVAQFFLVQSCVFIMQNEFNVFIYPSTTFSFKLSSTTIPWENSCKGSIQFSQMKRVIGRTKTEKNPSK